MNTQKNYGHNYAVEVVMEIIIRLQNKDKLKQKKTCPGDAVGVDSDVGTGTETNVSEVVTINSGIDDDDRVGIIGSIVGADAGAHASSVVGGTNVVPISGNGFAVSTGATQQENAELVKIYL